MHALALLAPASACAKERCACIAGRAEHALVKTSTSALKLGANDHKERAKNAEENVFTEQLLTQMKALEDAVTKHEEWPKYCHLECKGYAWEPAQVCAPSELQCSTPLSPTTVFFPSSYDAPTGRQLVEELKDPAAQQWYNYWTYNQYTANITATAEGRAAQSQMQRVDAVAETWDGSGSGMQCPAGCGSPRSPSQTRRRRRTSRRMEAPSPAQPRAADRRHRRRRRRPQRRPRPPRPPRRAPRPIPPPSAHRLQP